MLSLTDFINAVEENDLEVDAVMAIRNDTILGLHRFSDDIYHNVFSVAKSHLATAVGFAIDEEKLSLDDKPIDAFADIIPDDVDPRWNDVTLYNLMTMTSGHGEPFLMTSDRKKLRGETAEKLPEAMMDEWLIFAFTRPMMYEPGEKFSYGNLAPYVAGRMLEKTVGMSVCDYLYEKFWSRIGTAKPRWDTDSKGHTFPASDLFLDIVDMAKLGQLYASGGTYKGIRFLSKEWVKNAGAFHVPSSSINPVGNAIDEEAGYGFYFWRNYGDKNSYRCYGREAQFVIIMPDKNAVIAVQSMQHDVQPVMNAIWEYIFPQI